jgi:molecular chaperone GrpE (heat shock protein)
LKARAYTLTPELGVRLFWELMVLVQFDQLKEEARALPDFVDSMVDFSAELEKHWLTMNEIEKKLEIPFRGTKSTRKQEDEWAQLENQANELHIKILREEIDFQKQWKPSFQMHKESKSFEDFTKLVSETLEDNMLPISDALRVALHSRGEWIRAQKTDILEQRFKVTTLILTLVVFADVFAHTAEFFSGYEAIFIAAAFLTPIIISIVYIFFMYLVKSN